MLAALFAVDDDDALGAEVALPAPLAAALPLALELGLPL